MVMNESRREQPVNVVNALVVPILEIDGRQFFARGQVMNRDCVCVYLGDKIYIRRIIVGSITQVKEVVLYGDDLPAGLR